VRCHYPSNILLNAVSRVVVLVLVIVIVIIIIIIIVVVVVVVVEVVLVVVLAEVSAIITPYPSLTLSSTFLPPRYCFLPAPLWSLLLNHPSIWPSKPVIVTSSVYYYKCVL